MRDKHKIGHVNRVLMAGCLRMGQPQRRARGVGPSTGPGHFNPDPVERARLALQRGGRGQAALDFARVVYVGFLAVVCELMKLDLQSVRALCPQTHRRGFMAPGEIRAGAAARRRAVYLTCTAGGIKQRTVASVVGVTPVAVCNGCRQVEWERDDPGVDALLEAAAQQLVGTIVPTEAGQALLAGSIRSTIGA